MSGRDCAADVLERAHASTQAKIIACPWWAVRQRLALRRMLASIERHRKLLRLEAAASAAAGGCTVRLIS